VNGQNVLCMRIEHLLFLHSVSFLPMMLRSLLEANGQTARMTWYPDYFNTKTNLDYVGRIPNIVYYGADAMKETARKYCDGVRRRDRRHLITRAY
jgi:hypothetical protein